MPAHNGRPFEPPVAPLARDMQEKISKVMRAALEICPDEQIIILIPKAGRTHFICNVNVNSTLACIEEWLAGVKANAARGNL